MTVIGGNLAFGIQWHHFTTSRDSNVHDVIFYLLSKEFQLFIHLTIWLSHVTLFRAVMCFHGETVMIPSSWLRVCCHFKLFDLVDTITYNYTRQVCHIWDKIPVSKSLKHCSHLPCAHAFFFDLCRQTEMLNMNTITCCHRTHSWSLTQTCRQTLAAIFYAIGISFAIFLYGMNHNLNRKNRVHNPFLNIMVIAIA